VPWTLFSGLWSLRSLDLRGNHLRHLAAYTFSELTSLDSLLLADNSLKNVDSGLLQVGYASATSADGNVELCDETVTGYPEIKTFKRRRNILIFL